MGASAPPTLEHPALIYADLDGFRRSASPFIRTGLEREEPVFAAVGAIELEALRDDLGADTPAVLVDTREWTPHPATRLRAFHDFVTAELARGASSIRLVGEPAWETRPAFNREWARYESALNAVLGPFPVSLLCTYPSARLDPAIVEDARRTHPALLEGEVVVPSDRYAGPDELLRHWSPPLRPPPPDAISMHGSGDLHAARAFVTARATAAGVAAERLDDLALATTEILANAVEHGGGGEPVLRTWIADDLFVTQIEDEGIGGIPPLAGYEPPRRVLEDGRGLWIARQVMDLVEIAPSPSGTAVRLSVARS